MWTFPKDGMGTVNNNYNNYRTAMPAVEVSGNKANIYVYSMENGYAKYTMEVDSPTRVNTTKSNIGIRLNNRKICLSEQVKSVEVFTVGGQRMASIRNVSEIDAPAHKGIYLVSVVDVYDVKKVEKIIVQ